VIKITRQLFDCLTVMLYAVNGLTESWWNTRKCA